MWLSVSFVWLSRKEESNGKPFYLFLDKKEKIKGNIRNFLRDTEIGKGKELWKSEFGGK